MTTPSYLNVGADLGGFGLNVTPWSGGLPGTRTNGNILIFALETQNTTTHVCTSIGWHQLGVQAQANGWTASWWYCVVDGAEIMPTLTWNNSNVTRRGLIYQFLRDNVDTATPFGAVGVVSNGTTSTHSSSALTTTRNNSLVIYSDLVAVSAAMTTPSGWTEHNDQLVNSGRMVLGSKTVTTSGTSSGDISVTGATGAWFQVQFELLEPLAPSASAIATSGAIESDGTIPVASVTANVSAIGQNGATEVAGTHPVAIATNNQSAIVAGGEINIAGALPIATVGANVEALAGSAGMALSGQTPYALTSANVSAIPTAGATYLDGTTPVASVSDHVSVYSAPGALDITGIAAFAAIGANVAALVDLGAIALAGSIPRARIGTPLPCGRFVEIAAENRFALVASEVRFASIPGENRFVSLQGESRIISLPSEDRFLRLPKEDRFVLLEGDCP